MPDWSCEISVFECTKCYDSWDDYECERKLRLRKCSICHNEICKTCFYNPINKQHCHSCSFGKVLKEKNKCLAFKNPI